MAAERRLNPRLQQDCFYIVFIYTFNVAAEFYFSRVPGSILWLLIIL